MYFESVVDMSLNDGSHNVQCGERNCGGRDCGGCCGGCGGGGCVGGCGGSRGDGDDDDEHLGVVSRFRGMVQPGGLVCSSDASKLLLSVIPLQLFQYCVAHHKEMIVCVSETMVQLRVEALT